MESPKMILNLEDALVTINVGEAKEDILNEVSLTFLSGSTNWTLSVSLL